MKRFAIAFVALGAVALAWLAFARLRPTPPPATTASPAASAGDEKGAKVLLIGIDGGSFRVLDPLVADGRMPALAGLLERGARAPLRSENPMISPALWTTIVTGRSRSAHGITNFVLGAAAPAGEGAPGAGGHLVSSADRKDLALWNIAGHFGRRVGFVGWWASWPAEPVNGWIVSDRMTRERWIEWTNGGRTAQRTWPPELASRLEPLIVDPMQPPMDEVRRLVSLTDAETQEFLLARKPVFGHGPSVFKFAFCSQLSYERIALQLLDEGQPDLTGVFLVATDPVSHTFWHFYDPSDFVGVDPERAARLGQLVPSLYAHDDRVIAELLKRVDPQTVVIVVSDHGFEASGQLPAARPAKELFEGAAAEEARKQGVIAVGQSGKHQIDGIFIAAGGPIRRGVRTTASIYDVAPTVLALLGLPVPDDFEGRVLEEIVDPAFFERHPVQRISTYEGAVPRPKLDASGQDGMQEKLELLRSLGYVR